MTQPLEVSTHQLRADLATFLDSSETLAVTRHGQIIGYYIPARDPQKLREELRQFEASAERLRGLVEEMNTTEDELVEEFKVARAGKPRIETLLGRQIDALLERKPAGKLDIEALPLGNAEETIRLLEGNSETPDEVQRLERIEGYQHMAQDYRTKPDPLLDSGLGDGLEPSDENTW